MSHSKHFLDHAPDSPSSGDWNFATNSALSAPWTFLHPTNKLHTQSVALSKYIIDALASSVCASQSARFQNNRKRKRLGFAQEHDNHVLQLKQLYVEGFSSDQIWEQALRILQSSSEEIEHDYTRNVSLHHAQIPANRSDDMKLETDEWPIGGSNTPLEDDTDQSSDGSEEAGTESVVGSDALSHSDSEPKGMDDRSDDGNSEDGGDKSHDSHGQDTYTQDRFNLNDGFFSIDDFNRQSEVFEKQDARGGADDDSDSDEEDINWHSNPLASASSVANPKPLSRDTGSDNESSNEESDEEGPTFDNMGVHHELSSEGGSDAGGADDNGWVDTSDIKYSDFFAPPPRKATGKISRPLPKTQPRETDVDNDIDRAMADVRRDLFDDEGSADEMDASDNASGEPQGQRSTHEKRRAQIADEIRRLEAANVAKKEWMLGGEARAVERPVNSLIEEDMEFERVGKPVPIVTAEVSEDIEELVKRRILALEFDEIIRRHPGISDARDARRARFELDDAKPQQSLAELYETDHLRATDPNYVDPKDQKLVREHTEITNLWKEVGSQLDTLSNWHYKPKAPQPSINVVADVATITMEDARPTASSTVNDTVTLAPQEIYKPGDNGNAAGERVLKNGASVSKEEMTREEKARLRRQNKKQKKSGIDHSKQTSGKAAEKQQVVSDLRKGGVKVIGKQGEVTDIQGNRVSEMSAGGREKGADILKL
ncbi:rRNA-processing protein MPP10 [Aspergillus affinis]|uniref:rRNA-processing protein MPP10 n=1 Tax=Aspergillus affinis TaxID=1070780 RepID=UPI0022FDE431|nr:U3 small nucleolar ribonucleoprotein Mpp10 [Aspergillus affinis]KAI9039265.1 U3 small nucleolar ribonucleoprotein Mpp10 [Aspergillus affinis]